MKIRKTFPEEYRRINEIFAICFDMAYADVPAKPEHDSTTHWAAFDDCGEMMSSLTVSDFDIRFDENCVKMGGIGAVATLPQYRRQGCVRRCFQHAMQDMYLNGYDFSYLYPFSTAYYRKFGYENCVQKYSWKVDLSQLNLPEEKGYFYLADASHPMEEQIRKVSTVWESHFNMMLIRGTAPLWTVDTNPAVAQEFTYVCFSAQNEPNACTTFRTLTGPDGKYLDCSRFFFVGSEGFTALMGLFQSFASSHRYVKFDTPAIPAIQYFLPEWSMGAVQWEIRPCGMVRVIHVENVLKKARCLGNGEVSLEIIDSQIPENNGCFAVSFADGNTVRVSRAEKADVSMTIATFSAMISGVCDFSDAKAIFPDLKVWHETPAIHRLFYKKPIMIAEYF